MLGDHIRRRAERRHDEVLPLVDAGALLSDDTDKFEILAVSREHEEHPANSCEDC
ncbi:hypothetical protein BX257_2987 [Streptomyces sp. 3212.3]|nr:hypothetical protein BX257_2987 [Streptomyces sp. 3212.3]